MEGTPLGRARTLGLIGKGRMGQLVESKWRRDAGGDVVSVNSRSSVDEWRALERVDVLVDISSALATARVCSLACQAKLPWVLGTTGWESDRDAIQHAVRRAQIPCLVAPNFSLGIYLLRVALKALSPIASLLPNVHVSIRDVHHVNKRDQPSGTAKALRRDLGASNLRCPIAMKSERQGQVIGTHEVLIESTNECIALRHESKNRESLADGALIAAQWLMRQPPGWYEMDDLARDLAAGKLSQCQGTSSC